MPTSEPQAVTRDVLRRFVAALADRRRRRRLPAVVVGAPEVPLPLPGPRPTVLRPTPNTWSVVSALTFLECCNTVGLATERASSVLKICSQVLLKVLFGGT